MTTHLVRLALAAALSLPSATLAQQPAPAAAPLTAPPARVGVPDTSPFRILELPTPNGFRSASGMPGPMYWQQKASYTISASLDTATHTIHGDETIHYTNNSPDTLRYVWLQLDMNNGTADSRMAVLANPIGRNGPITPRPGVSIAKIEALRAAAPRARPSSTALTYRINSTMMRVDLDRPLPPRGRLDLAIAWHHQIPTNGRTGRTQQGALGWLYQVAQWYPRMAVYDDVRGWNTDQYISAEFYLEYGDFDVTLTLPAGFTVTATGVLRNPAEVLPAMIRERLAAAAHSDTIVHIIGPGDVGSATLLPPTAGATRTWRYHADNVRDFAWATAPNYLWDATSWDGTLMQALYPPDKIGAWRTAADMTRHAIMIHSQHWFHYPYPTAVSAQGPVGGMEYPMMTFDDDNDEKGLYYTIAHEQGHEWFPMIVGSNERLYPWMDEGFNTFIDLFPFRDRYPTDTMRIQSLEYGSMRAYQSFLRTYRGPETPIMETQDRSPGQISGWNAYGKPGVALHFLRNEVVDSAAFDLAFREYTRRWAFRHPTPADFFRSMNDALGEDLSWFWRSWFMRSDHLDQAIETVTQQDVSGQVITTVILSSRLEMVAPVELRITGADGSTRTVKLPVEAWLRGQRTSYRFLSESAAKPVRIEIDPRGVYPDIDRGNNIWNAPAGQ
jgi:hypothetical protein